MEPAAALEAILFVAESPVPVGELSEVLELPPADVIGAAVKVMKIATGEIEDDIDDDGLDEDVIWWVIWEIKGEVARASYLTEMYPSRPPRRPFQEASMLPVRGRRAGISLLEMLEGLHDGTKTMLDQTIDSNTLGIARPFFYRATSNMRNQTMAVMPGEGIALNDPTRDVYFPDFNNAQQQGVSINLITMLQQMEERVSVIGDFQLGRVPAGKSSALRTAGGMALLSGQGEARPERMMRRFFGGLAQVWRHVHQLNKYYLPKNKKYRIMNLQDTSKDPYSEIKSRAEISGEFEFKFKASVLNTSKQQMQAALQGILPVFISALTLQLGLTDPGRVYRLLRDYGKALGLDPDDYLRAPSPQDQKVRITAGEAIATIMRNSIPDGVPIEPGGALEHLQLLAEFAQSDNFGLLSQQQVDLFRDYMNSVRDLAAQQQQQQQMAAAVQQLQQTVGGGQQGRPAEGAIGNMENPPVSSAAELIDESLPGAGGGGQ